MGFIDDGYKIESLSIMLPKTSAYVKSYDGETKWMNFLTEDDELLISNCIKTEFDSKPIYNENF